MKTRSMSVLFALALGTSGALASETAGVISGNVVQAHARPAHLTLHVQAVDTLTEFDVGRLMYSAAEMPACSTCHVRQ